MTSTDGGHPYTKGASILLVRCGQVPADLMDRLAVELTQFIDHILPPDSPRPMVSMSSEVDPVIVDEHTDEWEVAFEDHANGISRSTITILVTGKGLWYRFPHERFIFAHPYGQGTVLLSIRRFYSPDRAAMYSRLGKEAIKVLGMALYLPPCHRAQCIMSYHWTPEDLDRNTGVCEACTQDIATSLARLMESGQNADGT